MPTKWACELAMRATEDGRVTTSSLTHGLLKVLPALRPSAHVCLGDKRFSAEDAEAVGVRCGKRGASQLNATACSVVALHSPSNASGPALCSLGLGKFRFRLLLRCFFGFGLWR